MDTTAQTPEQTEDPAIKSDIDPSVVFDLIAVGNVKVDIFFTLHEDTSKWRVTPRTKELALKVGEKIAVDRTDFSMGGNANNIAVGLSRLGYSVALMAELGDDAFADDVERNLLAEGVNGRLLVRTPGSRTSMGLIVNIGNQDRTLLSQHVARSHPFSFEGVASRLVYLTSIGYAWEHVYQKTLDFALANNVPIAFNPGTIQLREQPEVFWKVIKHTHILCVNREEAIKILEGAHSKLVKGTRKKEPTIEEMLVAVAELGPKIVLITDGMNGSYARAEDGRIFHQETIPAVAVERTGAGDSFMAGLLGAALAGKSLQEAMLWGTRNAAAVVGKVGAQEGLLTREQMESNIIDMRLIDLGYSDELIILPFDHRTAFAKYLFKVPLSKLTENHRQQIRDFKAIIYQAVKRSLDLGVPRASKAILVDEETGEEILKQAKDDNITTILSVEKSGQDELTFEYGAQYHQHIDKFKPTFTKVQVFYNMADSEASRKRQQEKLKEISDYSHERGYKFLLELQVRPTKQQIEQAGGEDEFDKLERPAMLVKIIEELQAAGVEPDVWNVEGMEKVEDYKQAVKAMRANGRDEVSMIVLGRGADSEKVDTWLEVAVGLPGVIGFAVGRTVFWEAISDYHHKKLSREEAVEVIAKNFSHFYRTFNQKVDSATSAVIPGLVPVSAENEEVQSDDQVELEPAVEAEMPAVEAEPALEGQEGESVEVKVDEQLQAMVNEALELPDEVESDAEPVSASEEDSSKVEVPAEEPEFSAPDAAMGVWGGGSMEEKPVESVGSEPEKQTEPAIRHGFDVGASASSEVPASPTSAIAGAEEDDDEAMPAWAVRRPEAPVKRVAEPQVNPVAQEDDNAPAGVKAVVGGFSIEPSFDVPEEEEEKSKKGLFGRLFGK